MTVCNIKTLWLRRTVLVITCVPLVFAIVVFSVLAALGETLEAVSETSSDIINAWKQ